MFKVGDKVTIVDTLIPGTQARLTPNADGTFTGTILSTNSINDHYVKVRNDGDGRSWHLGVASLVAPHCPMPEPEFDLEDMELAEIIIDELEELKL